LYPSIPKEEALIAVDHALTASIGIDDMQKEFTKSIVECPLTIWWFNKKMCGALQLQTNAYPQGALLIYGT
jgi:hypothetical protein